MAVQRINIINGVTLNVIVTDKFKTNYLSVNFINRLEKSTAALNALIPSILKRGTKNYPDIASLKIRTDDLYAASIGARRTKFGENHVVGFVCSMLNNCYALDKTDILGGVLDLLDEIIFNPLLENGIFKASYVEGEKKNLIDAIKAQINDKMSYAVTKCREEMCKDEAFGIPATGTAEYIAAITPESLYEQYKKLLKSSQIEIYFVGKTDIDALALRLKNMFLKCGDIRVPHLYTDVIRKAGKVREIIDDQPVEQGKLSLGFRTGTIMTDDDFYAFLVFNSVYSASPVSKLFMNVREKLSLCYYCFASPESQKGIMIVSSGIEIKNKQKTQDEILLQLENVKNGIITDDELGNAKRTILNSVRSIQDSPASLESWYMGRRLAGCNTEIDETAEHVNNITKEEVSEAAKKITLDTIYFLNGTLTEEKGADNDEE